MSISETHEEAVLAGLRTVRRGPWDVLDLTDLDQTLSEWLSTLSTKDLQELIERLNGHECDGSRL